MIGISLFDFFVLRRWAVAVAMARRKSNNSCLEKSAYFPIPEDLQLRIGVLAVGIATREREQNLRIDEAVMLHAALADLEEEARDESENEREEAVRHETDVEHPRTRNGFLGITFFYGHLCGKNAGIRISSAWASDPQLGLVARCGARAQIHFRGLCHWAGELTARQAAEPPSRRAAECTSARKSSPPRPHRPQGQFETHPAKWHVHTPPCSAFPLHSSPTHSYAWLFVVARATQFRGRKHSRPTGIR